MNTTAVTERYRYLGVTDECTECEQCGKVELRSTVVLQPLDVDGNFDGDPVYFGSTCAARALAIRGGGRVALQRARAGHHDTLMAAKDARRMLAIYGMPETGEPTEAEIQTGADAYARIHSNATWAYRETPATWRARALDMLARKRAEIAAAELVAPVCSFCHTGH
jgi:hypothetical protein